MNFKIIDEDHYQVYLNNLYFNPSKFNQKETIYLSLKEIFERIIKYYNIKFNGLYNVNIYIDNSIGTIITVIKEKDFDYLKAVDVKLKIYKDYNFKIKIIDKDLLINNKTTTYKPINIIEKIEFSI